MQIAADNNDFTEETLDRKNTTHATTMVVYQRNTFGPAPLPKVLADHATRRRSLQTSSSLYGIQEYSAHGRRPAVSSYVDLVKQDWYKCDNEIFSKASRTDGIWALLRLHPASFRKALNAEIGERQALPSWSGFNAILFYDMPQESNIGYCPMIYGNSTEFSTIYTVLKHAQMISTTLGQEDTVITFDLLIYIKAKQIQFRFPGNFSDVVIRLGGFHIALNFLSLVGEKYLNSGLDDLFIESGVYAAGTTSALMKGKSYNRGVRAHKLVMEAFFRLMWMSFVQWYNVCHAEVQIEEEDLLQKIADGISVVEQKGDVSQKVQQPQEELSELATLLEVFKSQARAKSKMFAFWEQYGDMINILLQFIKAERTGNWDLHLSAVATMVPPLFALDRPNYARWLPLYLADMNQLESKHPKVHQEFIAGNHSISRSGQPFSQVSTDMALEQSINADSKSKGGIVGITQSPAALNGWFLTAHERASITTALKEMYGLQDIDKVPHKEAAPKRVQRDEDDVRKLVKCFTSGFITNPFSEETESIVNFATGIVLPSDVAEGLVSSTERGREQMTTFIEKRVNTNVVNFWDTVPSLKVKTFSFMAKKVNVKAAEDKLITVKADRDLFGRLLIAANARRINSAMFACISKWKPSENHEECSVIHH